MQIPTTVANQAQGRARHSVRAVVCQTKQVSTSSDAPYLYAS